MLGFPQSPAMKAHDCLLHPRAVRHHCGERNPIGSLRRRLAPFCVPPAGEWSPRPCSKIRITSRTNLAFPCDGAATSASRRRPATAPATRSLNATLIVTAGASQSKTGLRSADCEFSFTEKELLSAMTATRRAGLSSGTAPTTRFLIWSPHPSRNARIWRGGWDRDRTGGSKSFGQTSDAGGKA